MTRFFISLFCCCTLLLPVTATTVTGAGWENDTSVSKYIKQADSARIGNDTYAEFSAYAQIGQGYMMKDMYDSAFVYLSKAYGLYNTDSTFLNKKSRRPIYMMFNVLAIHSANANMDYEKATEYLIAGMTLAQQYPEDSDYAIMGKNLVMIFFIRQNPAGLKYAYEIYRDGKNRKDEFLSYIGAYGLAQMYYLKSEYDSAYKYIDEAEMYTSTVSITTKNIRADIFAGMDMPDSAEFYYREAISLLEQAASTDMAYLGLSYGSFLRRQGRLNEALSILSKGLEYAQKSNNKPFLYRLYEELSTVHSELGNENKALEYYRLYMSESEKVFDIHQERAINDMTFRYETEKHKKEVSEHKLKYMQRTHQLQISVILIILTLTVSIVVYLMYRNKNRMYTTIVRQYKNALETENKLRNKIDILEKMCQKINAQGINDESHLNDAGDVQKDIMLFDELEKLMKEKKVYKNDTLTRETISEMIGTNRTYLTRIITDKAGMTFNQYINSYRIKEALSILSDPKNDIPLKALSAEMGFSSMTTFYKVFQDEVGMTPAKYRKKIIELSYS